MTGRPGPLSWPGASSLPPPEEGWERPAAHGGGPPALLPLPSSLLHLLPPPSPPTRHPAEPRYLQEGEFGGGGIHQAAAPGAVHQVPSPLQEHGVPGVVKLPGEALPRLVAKALGVARHRHALHASDPGAGQGSERRLLLGLHPAQVCLSVAPSLRCIYCPEVPPGLSSSLTLAQSHTHRLLSAEPEDRGTQGWLVPLAQPGSGPRCLLPLQPLQSTWECLSPEPA